MSFTYLFYQHIAFRKSCYKCHFSNIHRPSDLTIADFWGWEKTDANINLDDKGCSLILVNTEKGRKLFESIKGRMNVFPAKIDDCLQPNMCHPSPKHDHRDQFERGFSKYGFKYVYYRYGNIGPIYQIRKFKSWIRKILKK